MSSYCEVCRCMCFTPHLRPLLLPRRASSCPHRTLPPRSLSPAQSSPSQLQAVVFGAPSDGPSSGLTSSTPNVRPWSVPRTPASSRDRQMRRGTRYVCPCQLRNDVNLFKTPPNHIHKRSLSAEAFYSSPQHRGRAMTAPLSQHVFNHYEGLAYLSSGGVRGDVRYTLNTFNSWQRSEDGAMPFDYLRRGEGITGQRHPSRPPSRSPTPPQSPPSFFAFDRSYPLAALEERCCYPSPHCTQQLKKGREVGPFTAPFVSTDTTTLPHYSKSNLNDHVCSAHNVASPLLHQRYHSPHQRYARQPSKGVAEFAGEKAGRRLYEESPARCYHSLSGSRHHHRRCSWNGNDCYSSSDPPLHSSISPSNEAPPPLLSSATGVPVPSEQTKRSPHEQRHIRKIEKSFPHYMDGTPLLPMKSSKDDALSVHQCSPLQCRPSPVAAAPVAGAPRTSPSFLPQQTPNALGDLIAKIREEVSRDAAASKTPGAGLDDVNCADGNNAETTEITVCASNAARGANDARLQSNPAVRSKATKSASRSATDDYLATHRAVPRCSAVKPSGGEDRDVREASLPRNRRSSSGSRISSFGGHTIRGAAVLKDNSKRRTAKRLNTPPTADEAHRPPGSYVPAREPSKRQNPLTSAFAQRPRSSLQHRDVLSSSSTASTSSPSSPKMQRASSNSSTSSDQMQRAVQEAAEVLRQMRWLSERYETDEEKKGPDYTNRDLGRKALSALSKSTKRTTSSTSAGRNSENAAAQKLRHSSLQPSHAKKKQTVSIEPVGERMQRQSSPRICVDFQPFKDTSDLKVSGQSHTGAPHAEESFHLGQPMPPTPSPVTTAATATATFTEDAIRTITADLKAKLERRQNDLCEEQGHRIERLREGLSSLCVAVRKDLRKMRKEVDDVRAQANNVAEHVAAAGADKEGVCRKESVESRAAKSSVVVEELPPECVLTWVARCSPADQSRLVQLLLPHLRPALLEVVHEEVLRQVRAAQTEWQEQLRDLEMRLHTYVERSIVASQQKRSLDTSDVNYGGDLAAGGEEGQRNLHLFKAPLWDGFSSVDVFNAHLRATIREVLVEEDSSRYSLANVNERRHEARVQELKRHWQETLREAQHTWKAEWRLMLNKTEGEWRRRAQAPLQRHADLLQTIVKALTEDVTRLHERQDAQATAVQDALQKERAMRQREDAQLSERVEQRVLQLLPREVEAACVRYYVQCERAGAAVQPHSTLIGRPGGNTSGSNVHASLPIGGASPSHASVEELRLSVVQPALEHMRRLLVSHQEMMGAAMEGCCRRAENAVEGSQHVWLQNVSELRGKVSALRSDVRGAFNELCNTLNVASPAL